MEVFIEGSARTRPSSERTIYCDGTASGPFREGRDIELSHWIPNRTPREFKADTSTEICLRFAASGRVGDFDLAVNNHLDVDGVLSVFSIVESELALEHRDVLVEAAAMGDFGAWGKGEAAVLFQSLTLLLDELTARKADPQEACERCLARVRALLREGAPRGDRLEEGLRELGRSVARIESGEIRRTLHAERFASYAIPASLARAGLERCLRVPDFNEALSPACVLWQQARARQDGERVQLVSVDSGEGWFHDLWYPGYMWADVVRAWRAPGLVSTGGHEQRFEHRPLLERVERLRGRERARGRWEVARGIGPFEALEGRGFPVVLSFMQKSKPAPSSLSPDEVAPLLAEAFSDERVSMSA